MENNDRGPHDHNMTDHENDLQRCWRESPEPSVKINTYFPVYAELFGRLRGTDCTFIETGVLAGGSLFMWREWLGSRARIIGIDLNPGAAKWRDAGFEIYIGDQGDPEFWKETLLKIGRFDALLDDGGHQAFQQITTAHEAIRHADQKCVIAIEDTSTSFMNDFAADHGDKSFLEYAKAATDCIVARSFELAPDRFPSNFNREAAAHFSKVDSIQFFNGIVAFHVKPNPEPPRTVQNKQMTERVIDFRSMGAKQASVPWPSLQNRSSVTIGSSRPNAALVLIKAAIAKVRRLLSGTKH